MCDDAAASLVRVGLRTGATVVVRPAALVARNIILLKGGVANVSRPLDQRSTANLWVQYHRFFILLIETLAYGAVAGRYVAAVHLWQMWSGPLRCLSHRCGGRGEEEKKQCEPEIHDGRRDSEREKWWEKYNKIGMVI
ncbi:hypothetical protein SLA2020_096600 [Shorea laevis]